MSVSAAGNGIVQKSKTFARNNIDTKIVTSTVVSAFVLGGLVYAMKKSGFKPLAKAANLAK